MTTTTAQEATTMNTTTVTAQNLTVGDVILPAGNRVTTAPRHLGGTGLVAFGLTREDRPDWDGRLRKDSTLTVIRTH